MSSMHAFISGIETTEADTEVETGGETGIDQSTVTTNRITTGFRQIRGPKQI